MRFRKELELHHYSSGEVRELQCLEQRRGICMLIHLPMNRAPEVSTMIRADEDGVTLKILFVHKEEAHLKFIQSQEFIPSVIEIILSPCLIMKEKEYSYNVEYSFSNSNRTIKIAVHSLSFYTFPGVTLILPLLLLFEAGSFHLAVVGCELSTSGVLCQEEYDVHVNAFFFLMFGSV
ncbi:hypothetical protein llap_7215 [Limosa lapponica baueri]|uniref:Uncharacterized protein n=1 Tax=Limosa lapponica baueri TaxID=1758121 RepID=A0A2I0U8U9_LIMLA|nr:hypothetical protein llap_7215 [Limosa lapponica baueri]